AKGMDRENICGFTLVELAIVLVIIGLIIGAILVGQDLIEAAAVRAQVSQIEKYNAAVHTFQSKFNCLPGDCANAAEFGFVARGTDRGQGDGNGVIEGSIWHTMCSDNSPGCVSACGETELFWKDLSDADLIGGS